MVPCVVSHAVCDGLLHRTAGLDKIDYNDYTFAGKYSPTFGFLWWVCNCVYLYACVRAHARVCVWGRACLALKFASTHMLEQYPICVRYCTLKRVARPAGAFVSTSS